MEEVKQVEYIILAEFDINEGSTVRHEYPQTTGYDPSTLANIMLPDGVHRRESDWTVFFMNRSKEEMETQVKNRKANRRKRLDVKKNQMRDEIKGKIEALELERLERMSNRQEERMKLLEDAEEGDMTAMAKLQQEDIEEKEGPPTLLVPPMEVLLYRCPDSDTGWELMDEDRKIIIYHERAFHVFNDEGLTDLYTRIDDHPNLGYTQLESCFSCIFDEEGSAIGIRFVSEEDEDFFIAAIDDLEEESEEEESAGEAPSSPGSMAGASDGLAPPSRPSPIAPGQRSPAEPVSRMTSKSREQLIRSAKARSIQIVNEEDEADEEIAKLKKLVEDDELNRHLQDEEGDIWDAENEEREENFLYCLNLVRQRKDKTVKRGAVCIAMCVCTRQRYFHVFKPLLVLALEKCFVTLPQNFRSLLEELYVNINSMDIEGMPIVTDYQKKILKSNEYFQGGGSAVYQTYVNHGGAKIPIKIPYTMLEDEVGDVSVTSLVKLFQRDTVYIFNALFLEQRIFFISHDKPAGEVCNYVLAAVQLVCPPLTGIIKQCLPYVSLVDMDFLSESGFIVGATNPMFFQHTEMWDIICNIDTGKVLTSQMQRIENMKKLGRDSGEKVSPPPIYFDLDMELLEEVLDGIDAHHSEDRIRSLFQTYAQFLVDLAIEAAEFPSEDEKQRITSANAKRIQLFKKTKIHERYVSLRSNLLEGSQIGDESIMLHIRRLKLNLKFTDDEMISIYQDFLQGIRTEEQLTEFLSFFPANAGGLYPLAVNLFHSSAKVRIATAALFRRFDKLQSGASLIDSLNMFFLLAYERSANFLLE